MYLETCTNAYKGLMMKYKIKRSGDILEIKVSDLILNLFRSSKANCYRSLSYNFSCFRMSDYWAELGKKEVLIEILKTKNKGVRTFSNEEMILRSVVHEYGQSTVIAIYNWDMDKIGRIVDRIPGLDKFSLDQDIIAIPCYSVEVAKRIRDKMLGEMANTLVIDRGLIIP